MIAGSLVGGGAFVVYAAVAGGYRQWSAAVPVAGPLIQLGYLGRQINDCRGDACIGLALGGPFLGILMVVDTLAQAAGLAMLIAGASIQRRATPAVSFKPLRLAPSAGPGLVGLTLQGAF